MSILVDKIKKNLKQSRYIARRDGVQIAAYCVLHDLVTRLTPFSVYRVLRLEAAWLNNAYLENPDRYQISSLTADDMMKYADEPDNDLSPGFIKEAKAHGEECLAIFDGNVLSSYTWYSDEASHTRREIYLHFKSDYKYVHKGFTKSHYRGKRLLCYGLTKGCKIYTERGYKGLITLVEGHNINSLRAHRSIGSKIVGDIYIIMFRGRYFWFSNKGARQYGCYFKAHA